MPMTYSPLRMWNKHWRLDGSFVGCRRCGVVQYFTDSTPFSHALDCKARSLKAQYPFRELGAIVEQKIQDGLF
ncbi:hypothetical protein [Pseudomonas kulmbachensis]|uniref:Uncharacterized protein n=1 Tax=Pseudomonas kulmbachensis TaxID=3043408 RepID=A0ABW7M663_9PSED